MLLVEVAKALKRIGPWRLVIAGTGSLAGELTARVRAESLSKDVVFMGRLTRDRLFQLYRESTVLFHVSLTEGQPQIFYEAAAAGVPIVATEVGGVAAALAEGKRGVLVPPRDPIAFAEAVISLGADPTRRAAMIEAAWQWASTETLEAQTARVASFIEGTVLAATQLTSRSSGLRRRKRSPNHC
jgi:glycosyltransferase involved in cell wall biosynthesis